MPEEVLFETEQRQSREAIADVLRQVADTLAAGESITVSAGDQSVTVDPPAQPTFEIKVEREGPADGPGELGLEFELEWDEAAGDGGSGGDLTIE